MSAPDSASNSDTAAHAVVVQCPCSALVYTIEPPTVPGWYWERDGWGCEVIRQFPHCGQWPKSWKQRKADTLADADESLMSRLEALPDKNWQVMWAGPIPKPNKEYTHQKCE